ncbi:hypothetical protein ACFOWU_06360 [Epilithonimonas zeae]|uniref:Uncharacterized protein n=1 Tax=Epilithonimonas zeae TaxID=1416779 RepID=A0A1N6FL91_9FLAO|nr:hypothetical protein [Epilithonimonas zeae]SIN96024.1 hypothetical protein SAMN05444409_1337 [Epilithonimonas zeae]
MNQLYRFLVLLLLIPNLILSQDISIRNTKSKLNKDIPLLKKKKTTVIFSYNVIGCICPNWKNKNDFYYLEPINNRVKNASDLWKGNNLPLIVKLTGSLVEENGYPNYFTDKQLNKGAKKGKVFRYTKIEVIAK